LFFFYDPFGNNWVNIATSNDAGARTYRLRLRSTDFYGVDLENPSPLYGYHWLESPTLHGILLVRWLFNATNLATIHSHEDAIKLQLAARSNTSVLGSPLDTINWTIDNSIPAAHTLHLLAQLSSCNPPEIMADTARVSANLLAAGILNGTHTPTPPTSPSPTPPPSSPLQQLAKPP
jgi:hypothetical protein